LGVRIRAISPTGVRHVFGTAKAESSLRTPTAPARTGHPKEIVMLETIIGAMRAQIEKYSLEVLQRYPDDLFIHDRRMLKFGAVPGAQIAWVVGHCHTHLVNLGIHPDENQNVSYMTKLSSSDRFYLLKVTHSGFTLVEESREEFVALAGTPVPYHSNGDANSFSLFRGVSRIGAVTSEVIGSSEQRVFRGTIAPMAGVTALDRVALELWCDKALVKTAGTLFARTEVDWAPAIAMAQAA